MYTFCKSLIANYAAAKMFGALASLQNWRVTWDAFDGKAISLEMQYFCGINWAAMADYLYAFKAESNDIKAENLKITPNSDLRSMDNT